MSDVDNNPQTTRRQALRRIALFGMAALVAPSVLTTSEAEAGQRGSKNGSGRNSNSKSGRSSTMASQVDDSKNRSKQDGKDWSKDGKTGCRFQETRRT